MLDPVLDVESRDIDRGILLDLHESLDFAELPGNPDPKDKPRLMAAVLRFLLRVGDKGYTGLVDRFIPPPSEDNSYLWDAGKQAFEGVFLDSNRPKDDDLLRFVVKQTKGGWERSIRLVSAGGDPAAEFEESESSIDLAEDDLLSDREWDAIADSVSSSDVIDEALGAIANAVE